MRKLRDLFPRPFHNALRNHNLILRRGMARQRTAPGEGSRREGDSNSWDIAALFLFLVSLLIQDEPMPEKSPLTFNTVQAEGSPGTFTIFYEEETVGTWLLRGHAEKSGFCIVEDG